MLSITPSLWKRRVATFRVTYAENSYNYNYLLHRILAFYLQYNQVDVNLLHLTIKGTSIFFFKGKLYDRLARQAHSLQMAGLR